MCEQLTASPSSAAVGPRLRHHPLLLRIAVWDMNRTTGAFARYNPLPLRDRLGEALNSYTRSLSDAVQRTGAPLRPPRRKARGRI